MSQSIDRLKVDNTQAKVDKDYREKVNRVAGIGCVKCHYGTANFKCDCSKGYYDAWDWTK